MKILTHNERSLALKKQWQVTQDGSLMDEPDWQFISCDECERSCLTVIVFPRDWCVCEDCLKRGIELIQSETLPKLKAGR